MSYKEKILGYIIGVNPTGTLDYNGTYNMMGNTNIVQDAQSASKSNLEKTHNNEIVCDQIENFENYVKENNKEKFAGLFFLLILFLIIFIYFIFNVKK